MIDIIQVIDFKLSLNSSPNGAVIVPSKIPFEKLIFWLQQQWLINADVILIFSLDREIYMPISNVTSKKTFFRIN